MTTPSLSMQAENICHIYYVDANAKYRFIDIKWNKTDKQYDCREHFNRILFIYRPRAPGEIESLQIHAICMHNKQLNMYSSLKSLN